MVEVDIYLNRPSTLPLAIIYHYLVLTVEVDLGLIPDTLPLII